MKTCIICRKEKNESEFNDEHVIPDSIDGYYIIRSVCTKCNSDMGSKIDNKLTNHKFIDFQRSLLGIKGKSGEVPNPFSGTHTLMDDENQKLRLEVNDKGQFEVRLLPKVSTHLPNFSIVIDKKDEAQADKTLDKILKRHGIPKEAVKTERRKYEEKQHPWVQTTLNIDLKNFRMSLLKIAYEFAVTEVPSYFSDPKAITISKILEDADFARLDVEIKFIGSGFDKNILQPFSNLIDFENENHYLILFDDPHGLLCVVNLFNVFSIGIILSDSNGFMDEQESMIVGKNDIKKKTFTILPISKILTHTHPYAGHKFGYIFPNADVVNEFFQNEASPEFSFYREGDQIPFFYRNGEIAYPDLEDKLIQLPAIPKGDTINELSTEYMLDEELYIKVLPINKIYQVEKVRIERFRRNKI